MRKITKPPTSRESEGAGKAFKALPAEDRMATLQIESRPGVMHISSNGGAALNPLFNKLATTLFEQGYKTPHVDMEREWMRDSDGWNSSLRARFEIQKDGRTIAAVELRTTRAECDHIMVCHSSKTDAGSVEAVLTTIGSVVGASS